jgi:hypothetical protein
MRRLVALVLFPITLAACLQVLGEYTLNPDDDGSGAGHPTASCHEDSDCANGDGCDKGGRCRRRCVQDSDCPAWSHCFSSTHLCSMFPGEPCAEDSSSDSTCGHLCLKVDQKAQPTSSYCAISCISTDGQCPAGFVCSKYDCYKVSQ